jgi:RNA polymerase sigma-70 factor (ECF subfamily)
VVQNVFLSVASNIADFRHGRPGDTFRGWLATVCRNKILDIFRSRQTSALAAGGSTAQHLILQVPIPEPGSEEAECERRRMRHRAVALLRDQFECDTWQAFVRTVVNGDRAADVAHDLGISVASVYRAKIQVLTQLRAELDGL